MAVHFSDAWTYHGLQALVIENEALRVTVLPELGGKIWSIVAKRHDREMLWHHPRMVPRKAPFGATYDNWFCGGWDDIFPNDFPVDIDGEMWPDHGEVWSLPARWWVETCSDQEVAIGFEHQGIVIPTRFHKILRLRAGEASLQLDYQIANEGRDPLDLHWKSHPALPLGNDARLHLPIRTVIDEPGFGEVFQKTSFAWPQAPRADGSLLDLRTLPAPDSGAVQFWYGTELTSGWAAVSYPAAEVGFGLTFDQTIQNSVWVFTTAGGWRNLNVVILEPCTGYHADLGVAKAAGSVLTLVPGQTVSANMSAHILSGMDAVARFEASHGVDR